MDLRHLKDFFQEATIQDLVENTKLSTMTIPIDPMATFATAAEQLAKMRAVQYAAPVMAAEGHFSLGILDSADLCNTLTLSHSYLTLSLSHTLFFILSVTFLLTAPRPSFVEEITGLCPSDKDPFRVHAHSPLLSNVV